MCDAKLSTIGVQLAFSDGFSDGYIAESISQSDRKPISAERIGTVFEGLVYASLLELNTSSKSCFR